MLSNQTLTKHRTSDFTGPRSSNMPSDLLAVFHDMPSSGQEGSPLPRNAEPPADRLSLRVVPDLAINPVQSSRGPGRRKSKCLTTSAVFLGFNATEWRTNARSTFKPESSSFP